MAWYAELFPASILIKTTFLCKIWISAIQSLLQKKWDRKNLKLSVEMESLLFGLFSSQSNYWIFQQKCNFAKSPLDSEIQRVFWKPRGYSWKYRGDLESPGGFWNWDGSCDFPYNTYHNQSPTFLLSWKSRVRSRVVFWKSRGGILKINISDGIFNMQEN